MLEDLKRKVLNTGAYWLSFLKLRSILKEIDSSSLIIDCGANVGDISALFLAKGARVIAFEPDPLAFNLLKSRFDGLKNMTCIQSAVSDRDGKAQLYFHKNRALTSDKEFTVCSSLIAKKINVDELSGAEVNVLDLCKFILDLDQRVDILKLDVEGEEIAILKKLISAKLYEKIGLILVETHETKIPGHLNEVTQLKGLIQKGNIKNIRLNWI
jgi:FkbM family methyltransferase